MGKYTEKGKDAQGGGGVSPSAAAVYSADKKVGLSTGVTETEYLEQKGALSPLSLEPHSPFSSHTASF